MANQVTLLNPADLIAKYNVHPEALKIVNPDFFATACKLVNETFVTDPTAILSWDAGEILCLTDELTNTEARIIITEMAKPTHITPNEWDDLCSALSSPRHYDANYHLTALLLLEQYSFDNATTWIAPNHCVSQATGVLHRPMVTVGKLSSLALVTEESLALWTSSSSILDRQDYAKNGVEMRWVPEAEEFAFFYAGTFHCRYAHHDMYVFDPKGDRLHPIEIAMTPKSELIDLIVDTYTTEVKERADRLMPYVKPVQVESLSLSDMWKAAHEAIEGAITFAQGSYDFGPYTVSYTDLNDADDKALTVRINGILVGTFSVGALCDIAVYTSMSLWQSGSEEMMYILPMFINQTPADVIKTCLKGLLRRYAHDTNLMSDQQFENVIDPMILGGEPREDVEPLTVTAVQGHLFDF